jgi:sugar-specific transcriptional regulator TrmB
MKDITPILRSLGLTESEVSTYLTALEKGPSTVLDLAKAAGLSRQAVYVAIDALGERGLMSSTLVGKRSLYSADAPEQLLAYAKRHEQDLRRRTEELERLLPELKLQVGGEKPVVRVYEGKEGIRASLADVQRTKPKEAYEIADLDAVRAVMPAEEVEPVRRELKKIGTKVYGIYSGKMSDTELKVDRLALPKELGGFNANITVYEDKVAMITLENKLYSILIESASLANAIRTLFKLAMKNAEKP